MKLWNDVSSNRIQLNLANEYEFFYYCSRDISFIKKKKKKKKKKKNKKKNIYE